MQPESSEPAPEKQAAQKPEGRRDYRLKDTTAVPAGAYTAPPPAPSSTGAMLGIAGALLGLGLLVGGAFLWEARAPSVSGEPTLPSAPPPVVSTPEPPAPAVLPGMPTPLPSMDSTQMIQNAAAPGAGPAVSAPPAAEPPPMRASIIPEDVNPEDWVQAAQPQGRPPVAQAPNWPHLAQGASFSGMNTISREAAQSEATLKRLNQQTAAQRNPLGIAARQGTAGRQGGGPQQGAVPRQVIRVGPQGYQTALPPSARPAPPKPLPVPAFAGKSLPTVDRRRTVALDSCPAGQCLVIYVSPWCPYCRHSTDVINRMRATLAAEGVATRIIVGMDKPDAVAQYAAEFGPDTLDDGGRSLKIRGVPAFILTDRSGNVVRSTAGEFSNFDEAMRWARGR